MFCKQLNFPSEKTCWVLILVLMRGFLCDRVLAAVFWLLLGRGGLEPVFTGPAGDRQCWVNAPSDRPQQVLTWGNAVSGSTVSAACELGWAPCPGTLPLFELPPWVQAQPSPQGPAELQTGPQAPQCRGWPRGCTVTPVVIDTGKVSPRLISGMMDSLSFAVSSRIAE